MNVRSWIALAVAATVFAACSSQTKYEREAQDITIAVMANNIEPVQNDISPRVHITRVQIAQASDELSQQGKLLSIKETTQDCPPEAHCFNVKFEKSNYLEMMKLDENGKVYDWHYKMAPANAAGN